MLTAFVDYEILLDLGETRLEYLKDHKLGELVAKASEKNTIDSQTLPRHAPA